MKGVFTGILLGCALSVSAQNRGVVTVLKDPMIDSLIAKRIALSTSTTVGAGPTSVKPAPIVSSLGYRVQVFYGADRRQAYRQQSKFNGLYPDLNTYITYKEPNYYLRVGDFRSRLEAQRLMNELRSVFPTLFIFREKINAPNLDYSND